MQPSEMIVVRLAGRRFGFVLKSVARVLPRLEIMHLPGAPEHVVGVVEHLSEHVPVYSMRSRLGLDDGDSPETGYLILVKSRGRPVALLVDTVLGVEETSADDWRAATPAGDGLLLRSDGLTLIGDLDRLVTLPDDRWLTVSSSRETAR